MATLSRNFFSRNFPIEYSILSGVFGSMQGPNNHWISSNTNLMTVESGYNGYIDNIQLIDVLKVNYKTDGGGVLQKVPITGENGTYGLTGVVYIPFSNQAVDGIYLSSADGGDTIVRSGNRQKIFSFSGNLNISDGSSTFSISPMSGSKFISSKTGDQIFIIDTEIAYFEASAQISSYLSFIPPKNEYDNQLNKNSDANFNFTHKEWIKVPDRSHETFCHKLLVGIDEQNYDPFSPISFYSGCAVHSDGTPFADHRYNLNWTHAIYIASSGVDNDLSTIFPNSGIDEMRTFALTGNRSNPVKSPDKALEWWEDIMSGDSSSQAIIIVMDMLQIDPSDKYDKPNGISAGSHEDNASFALGRNAYTTTGGDIIPARALHTSKERPFVLRGLNWWADLDKACGLTWSDKFIDFYGTPRPGFNSSELDAFYASGYDIQHGPLISIVGIGKDLESPGYHYEISALRLDGKRNYLPNNEFNENGIWIREGSPSGSIRLGYNEITQTNFCACEGDMGSSGINSEHDKILALSQTGLLVNFGNYIHDIGRDLNAHGYYANGGGASLFQNYFARTAGRGINSRNENTASSGPIRRIYNNWFYQCGENANYTSIVVTSPQSGTFIYNNLFENAAGNHIEIYRDHSVASEIFNNIFICESSGVKKFVNGDLSRLRLQPVKQNNPSSFGINSRIFRNLFTHDCDVDDILGFTTGDEFYQPHEELPNVTGLAQDYYSGNIFVDHARRDFRILKSYADSSLISYGQVGPWGFVDTGTWTGYISEVPENVDYVGNIVSGLPSSSIAPWADGLYFNSGSTEWLSSGNIGGVTVLNALKYTYESPSVGNDVRLRTSNVFWDQRRQKFKVGIFIPTGNSFNGIRWTQSPGGASLNLRVTGEQGQILFGEDDWKPANEDSRLEFRPVLNNSDVNSWVGSEDWYLLYIDWYYLPH